MNASQVFAYHAEGEKLCAGKDGNDRREKRKSWHASLQAVTDDDIKENRNAKQRAAKPNQARQLQRQSAKAGHHVKCMA